MKTASGTVSYTHLSENCCTSNLSAPLQLASGASNKEIARKLDLAESTVKIHVQGILRKLNLASRVQAAVYAVEHGFVTEQAKVPPKAN